MRVEKLTVQEQSNIVRFLLTCILMCEYSLINLGDNVDPELKKRIKNAIGYCRNVQGFFVNNKNVSPDIKTMFKQQFMGGEVVLLTELVELCFGMPEIDLEDIIRQLKEAKDTETKN
jgi:hypothetical protein